MDLLSVPAVSAKRLTAYPGQTVTVQDAGAYGVILIQGYGKMNDRNISTPALIRYRELTEDEFFVSEKTAKAGVTVQNSSSAEPIVMLKLFAAKSGTSGGAVKFFGNDREERYEKKLV